jgi:hypothetical protein
MDMRFRGSWGYYEEEDEVCKGGAVKVLRRIQWQRALTFLTVVFS